MSMNRPSPVRGRARTGAADDAAEARETPTSRLVRASWPRLSPVTLSNWAIFPALGILLVICAIFEPNIVTKRNLLLTLQANAPIGLLAIGETFVILTAGIDLSVGAVMGVVNWLAASMINGSNSATPAAVLACLAVGAGVGLLNGIGVAKLRVPPFVMTLGMLFIVNAVGALETNGIVTGSASASLIAVGSNSVAGIPASGLVMAGLLIVAWVILTRTVLGRRIYAIGTNERAARLGGIPVDRSVIGAYVICGVCAAAGGLLITGYIHGASTTTGTNAELTAIAACAIGGVVLSGGRGSAVGAIGGVLFLGVLFDLLVQLSIGEYAQQIGEGVAIAAAGIIYGRVGGVPMRR
jgi:ribose/xylose/arabinose/galactoside ABC-type transport system permease subunit